MYNALRNIHLALGLFGSLFLLAYGISAVEMAHPPLFKWTKSSVVEETISIPDETSPRKLATYLMSSHGLAGDLMSVETTSISMRLEIVRPGVVHRVSIDPASRVAKVKTERGDLIRTLNRIHHISGLWHEHWVINAWAWFLMLVSIALFGTGLSGLVMWWQRKADRKIGTAMILLSLGWGASLLVLVRI